MIVYGVNPVLEALRAHPKRVRYNGVVADVEGGAYADFHDTVSNEETKFVLILDGITDPQNFGAILRVADGFGIDLVVTPQHESVGLTPAAVKASAGASQWVS